LRHLDLFSGIGGFALAARNVWGDDHQVVSFCDIEPFAQKVLKKHWPDVPCHDDIKTMKGTDYANIDLLTGGFPCQPFSQAGQRRGSEDDRHLWPEMLRVIRECKPRWIVGENVRGLINWDEGVVFNEVLSDLEDSGYRVQSFLIPAISVGAEHRRDRVWIVANSKCERLQGHKPQKDGVCCKQGQALTISGDRELYERDFDMGAGIVRDLNGLSRGVDRVRGLGNAIVPQVAMQIFKTIKKFGFSVFTNILTPEEVTW